MPDGKEDQVNEERKTQSFYIRHKGKLVKMSPNKLAQSQWKVKTAFSSGGWTKELDDFAGDTEDKKDLPAEKVVELISAKDTDDAVVTDIPDVPFHWIAKYKDHKEDKLGKYSKSTYSYYQKLLTSYLQLSKFKIQKKNFNFLASTIGFRNEC